jgi:hypothetical protein
MAEDFPSLLAPPGSAGEASLAEVEDAAEPVSQPSEPPRERAAEVETREVGDF